MSKMTVYNKMIAGPTELFNVIRQEIGLKCDCLPFAVKAIEALNTLGPLTESESLKAANVFLDNMQTLAQGGITAKDYDKTDFVKRGKTITISARVEAFYRAAARKGYRITDTIVAVPTEDGNTTYFKEQFHNGEIVYLLEDKRINGDRKITAERLVNGYFVKFICRLEIVEIQTNKRLIMDICEMSNDEVLNASMASDSGIYKSSWETYTDNWGKSRKRKVISNELNSTAIWCVWTAAMVEKTLIRRALKRIREVLPELKDTIYAFDTDVIQQEQLTPADKIEIPLEVVNVDLANLTEKQLAEAQETYELFKANPKLAKDMVDEINSMFNGNNLQEVINTHYASIVNIKLSENLYPLIQAIFDGEKTADKDILQCAVCGKEIKNEKSKRYYAEHPTQTVKCFGCYQGGNDNA